MEKKLKNYVCFVDPTSPTSGAARISEKHTSTSDQIAASIALADILRSATRKAQAVAKGLGINVPQKPTATRTWSYDPVNQKSDLFNTLRGK